MRDRLIDGELHLTKSWIDNPRSVREAAIPAYTTFATKPRHARAMIERAVTARLPCAWFTVDQAFGQNPSRRD